MEAIVWCIIIVVIVAITGASILYVSKSKNKSRIHQKNVEQETTTSTGYKASNVSNASSNASNASSNASNANASSNVSNASSNVSNTTTCPVCQVVQQPMQHCPTFQESCPECATQKCPICEVCPVCSSNETHHRLTRRPSSIAHHATHGGYEHQFFRDG